MKPEHTYMAVIAVSTEAPLVAGPPHGQWTYADWETLPDDGNRYEVIEGVLYVTTAPSFFHQWIVRRLERFIGIPAEDQGLAFSAMGPVGLLMPGCDPVQPDYVVILKSKGAIIHGRRIWGVPDLIFEILSTSNTDYDEKVKLEIYAKAGVPEYVIVDPRARELRHHRLEAPGQYARRRVFGERETATFDCLPGIGVPVAELFSGAPDTEL